MSLEFLAILATIFTFSTSFIYTKAFDTAPLPAFLYIHIPFSFPLFAYFGLPGLLIASVVLTVASIPVWIYVFYNDLW
jgi:hypothetical protein